MVESLEKKIRSLAKNKNVSIPLVMLSYYQYEDKTRKSLGLNYKQRLKDYYPLGYKSFTYKLFNRWMNIYNKNLR